MAGLQGGSLKIFDLEEHRSKFSITTYKVGDLMKDPVPLPLLTVIVDCFSQKNSDRTQGKRH